MGIAKSPKRVCSPWNTPIPLRCYSRLAISRRRRRNGTVWDRATVSASPTWKFGRGSASCSSNNRCRMPNTAIRRPSLRRWSTVRIPHRAEVGGPHGVPIRRRPGPFRPDDRRRGAATGEPKLETLTLDVAERILVKKALDRHDGNVARAARDLGLSRPALYRKVQRHGL